MGRGNDVDYLWLCLSSYAMARTGCKIGERDQRFPFLFNALIVMREEHPCEQLSVCDIRIKPVNMSGHGWTCILFDVNTRSAALTRNRSTPAGSLYDVPHKRKVVSIDQPVRGIGIVLARCGFPYRVDLVYPFRTSPDLHLYTPDTPMSVRFNLYPRLQCSRG